MSTMRFQHTLAAVSLLLLVGLGGSLPSLAQSGGRSATSQRFHVDLAIQGDGTIVGGGGGPARLSASGAS